MHRAGEFNLAEVVDIVEDVQEERKEVEAQKRNKMLFQVLLLLSATVVILVGAIFGLSWVVAIQMKDTYNKNNYMASADGHVMRTAAAAYAAPLYVAGVLPLDTLASIERVTLGVRGATKIEARATLPVRAPVRRARGPAHPADACPPP